MTLPNGQYLLKHGQVIAQNLVVILGFFSSFFEGVFLGKSPVKSKLSDQFQPGKFKSYLSAVRQDIKSITIKALLSSQGVI